MPLNNPTLNLLAYLENLAPSTKGCPWFNPASDFNRLWCRSVLRAAVFREHPNRLWTACDRIISSREGSYDQLIDLLGFKHFSETEQVTIAKENNRILEGMATQELKARLQAIESLPKESHFVSGWIVRFVHFGCWDGCLSTIANRHLPVWHTYSKIELIQAIKDSSATGTRSRVRCLDFA